MSTYSVIYHTNPYQRAQAKAAAAHRQNVRTIRRKKAAKRQLITALVLFFTVLASVLIISNCLRANQVKASSVKTENIYYKTVEVEDGDTLWDLADRYMGEKSFSRQEYIEQVKELNHLSGDTIESGAYLMVPYVETFSELY